MPVKKVNRRSENDQPWSIPFEGITQGQLAAVEAIAQVAEVQIEEYPDVRGSNFVRGLVILDETEELTEGQLNAILATLE